MTVLQMTFFLLVDFLHNQLPENVSYYSRCYQNKKNNLIKTNDVGGMPIRNVMTRDKLEEMGWETLLNIPVLSLRLFFKELLGE